LQVEGVQIRRTEPDDYSAYYEIFCGAGVFPGTLQLPYPSREEWRRKIAEPNDGTYSLVAVVDGRVVGMVAVITFPNRPRKRHAGSIAISVHEEWQGKKIGTALMQAAVDLADNWLNLTRLQLEVYTDNQSAIRLYERFGFEREGTLRQDAFRNGEYADSYVMGRLRPPRTKT